MNNGSQETALAFDDPCADLTHYDLRSDYVSLPPLIRGHTAQGYRRPESVLLAISDAIFGNAGSICFVIGSILFYPSYLLTHKYRATGTTFFIIGSGCYLLCCTFTLAATLEMEHPSDELLANAILFVFANTLFVAGSILFLPYFRNYLSLGIYLFIVGSCIFIAAPAYNMNRALHLKKSGIITDAEYERERRLSWLYVVGSTLFVGGSIVYFPFSDNVDSMNVGATAFLVGSLIFLVATATAPLEKAMPHIQRALRPSMWDSTSSPKDTEGLFAEPGLETNLPEDSEALLTASVPVKSLS